MARSGGVGRAPARRRASSALSVVSHLARCPLTLALLSACAAQQIALELWGEPGLRRAVLWSLGALSRGAAQEGEVFRLLASAFLHVDLTHFLGNACVLLGVGSVLEPAVGSRPMLLYVLFGALASSLAHVAVFESESVVGASGWLQALALSAAVLRLRGEWLMPAPLRAARPRWPWTFLLALLGGPFVLAAVSQARWVVSGALAFGVATEIFQHNAAHLGGLAAGLALGLVARPPGLARGARRSGRAALGAVASGFAGALLLLASAVAWWVGKPWEIPGAVQYESRPLPGTRGTLDVPVRALSPVRRTAREGWHYEVFGDLSRSPVKVAVGTRSLEPQSSELDQAAMRRDWFDRQLRLPPAASEVRREAEWIAVGGRSVLRVVTENSGQTYRVEHHAAIGATLVDISVTHRGPRGLAPRGWGDVGAHMLQSVRLPGGS